MLNKNCDNRPLAKDIIRTPYVVGHLNDLLSYTVKKKDGGGNFSSNCINPKVRLSNENLPVGNFGPHGANIPAAVENIPVHLDPELAEKQIEVERNRQKEEQIRQSKDSKEAKVIYVLLINLDC